MFSAGRKSSTSGSKVVVAAVVTTISAVGFMALYLPFYADRDKMRGMDEAGGLTDQERYQMEAYLKKRESSSTSGSGSGGEATTTTTTGGASSSSSSSSSSSTPGSMWKNFKR